MKTERELIEENARDLRKWVADRRAMEAKALSRLPSISDARERADIEEFIADLPGKISEALVQADRLEASLNGSA